MWWIIGLAAIVSLVGVAAVWLLAPTIRTFGRADFEPASKDDVSVLLAQQPGMVDGGQGVL